MSFNITYLLTVSEVFAGKSQVETVKTERSRLIISLLYGFLLGFCRPVIGPWALRENNALVWANHSARYIGYKHKSSNKFQWFFHFVYNNHIIKHVWRFNSRFCSLFKVWFLLVTNFIEQRLYKFSIVFVQIFIITKKNLSQMDFFALVFKIGISF